MEDTGCASIPVFFRMYLYDCRGRHKRENAQANLKQHGTWMMLRLEALAAQGLSSGYGGKM